MNNVDIPLKDELQSLYNKEYSIKDIANLLGMSVGKIYKYFKIYGITTRKQGLSTEKALREFRYKRKIKPWSSKNVKRSAETKEKISISKSAGIGKKSISKTGYVRIYFPDHPKSDSYGYIFEHDLIMECNLGRWLNKDEIVHHKNGIKTDNRIKNLEVLTRSEHMSLHRKERNDENV